MEEIKSFKDFETVGLLKKHLISSPNLICEVSAKESWNGWYQLREKELEKEFKFYDIFSEIADEVINVEKNPDGTQNVIVNENYKNGFSLLKEVYEEGYITWAKGTVEKDFFVEKINEYINLNSENDDPYDFFDFLDFGSNPDGIVEYFKSNKSESGVGTEVFLNDITWYVPNFVNWGEFDFMFKKVESKKESFMYVTKKSPELNDFLDKGTSDADKIMESKGKEWLDDLSGRKKYDSTIIGSIIFIIVLAIILSLIGYFL